MNKTTIPKCEKCGSKNVGFEDWGISRGDEDTNIVFVCYECGHRFRNPHQRIW